jgi:hypothetical protein
MKALYAPAVAVLVLLCAVIPLSAHHSWPVSNDRLVTVKPGDVITGIGYQYKDGEKIIRLERVVLADGKELRVYAK